MDGLPTRALGKSDLNPEAFAFYRPQNWCQRIAVLDIGGRDLALDRQAQCIQRNMPLPALDLLASIVTPWTDCASAITAVGAASRPACSRAF